ncbi:MAG: GNAT family N-acetyltransferase [Pseudomonadota bacterium]
MIIRKFSWKDKFAWDEYVLSHPHGSAYHLTAWGQAVKNAYGFEGCYLMAQTGERNPGRICGVLPLIHHHAPLSRGSLISLPYCDVAGPLADSQEIAEQLIRAALNIAGQQSIKKVSLRCFSPLPGDIEGETVNHEKVRMMLNLPGTSNQLLASFKAKLRSQILKPLRDGLFTEVGGIQNLRFFYPMFAENMRDLGSPVHSIKWLRAILVEYGNRAHLVVVRLPDKTLAAGGIILCHSNLVSIPWASSLRRLNHFNPNMILYWTFLRFACDRAYPVFDFGRSTKGEGTYRFKNQWGAKPGLLNWKNFSSENRLRTDLLTDMKGNKPSIRGYLERIYGYLPTQFSTCIGSNIRKYITL